MRISVSNGTVNMVQIVGGQDLTVIPSISLMTIFIRIKAGPTTRHLPLVHQGRRREIISLER